MWRLTLGPVTPRGALAFGLVTGMFLAAAGGGFVMLVSRPRMAAIGVVGSLVWIGAGVAFPSFFRFAYKAWNYAAKRVARYLNGVTSAVCFYSVVSLASIAGSSLTLDRERGGRSLWTRRVQTSTRPDASRYFVARRLLRRRENAWAVCLAPFAFLLALTIEEPDAGAPADIYTLF